MIEVSIAWDGNYGRTIITGITTFHFLYIMIVCDASLGTVVRATVKAGMQERGMERRTEDAKCARNKKYAIMNAHAHTVKAHMVIGATVKSTV